MSPRAPAAAARSGAAATTVTLKRIAEHCGLSLQTVGAVLGSRAHLFRPETRERVLRSAAQLGYRPNSAAKAMRSGRFGCAALVLSDNPWRSTLFREQVAGMDQALAADGMHLAHALMPDHDLREHGRVPKILGELMADSLLINYNTGVPAALERVMAKHRLPAIWMNVRRARDCVHPDDAGAGHLATAHLLALGHRRIAYVDYCHATGQGDQHYSAADRQAGYAQAMRAAGLAPRIIGAAHQLGHGEYLPTVRAWLAAADRPTALVTYCGREAGAALYAAALLGIAVPRELSIVAIDDRPVDPCGVQLTTVLLPRYDLGRVAVELLLERIAAPARALPPRCLPVRLEPGMSSAAG